VPNFITNPIISPEKYKVMPTSSCDVYKFLYISHKESISPQIITDTLSNILSTFFPSTIPFLFNLNHNLHMYCDSLLQYVPFQENRIATLFYRNYFSSHHGILSKDVVHGHAIVFSSDHTADEFTPNSVPYNIVEEVVLLHEFNAV